MPLMCLKKSSTTRVQTIPQLVCPICLEKFPATSILKLKHCRCAFCTQCLESYIKFAIDNGNVSILCPQSQCKQRGKLSSEEIVRLTDPSTLSKYHKLKQERSVERDPTLTFCPRPGCDGICRVRQRRDSLSAWLHFAPDEPVSCPKCEHKFCAVCRHQWHPGVACDIVINQLPVDQRGVPYESCESDTVKRCPSCSCPIERTEGCAQVACQRCAHIFCWFCLHSLEDDFFLRHYDKGPCRNRLGHSRASIIWHRIQVAGVFAGVGIFLIVSSPFLLLAAPFLLCYKFKPLSSCLPGTATVAAAVVIERDQSASTSQ